MAMVQIFRDNSQNVVLVPWARHPTIKGMNTASGKMIHLTVDQFLTNGTDLVNELLSQFETRDGSAPSELYEEYSAKDKKKFLAKHKVLAVIHYPNQTMAKIDTGDPDRIELCWPLDGASFPAQILRTFDEL